MLNFFNRKELLLTYDIDYRLKVQYLLTSNNIRYFVKVENMLDKGNIGIKSGYMYMYYIYVHKKDFEKARYILKEDNDKQWQY